MNFSTEIVTEIRYTTYSTRRYEYQTDDPENVSITRKLFQILLQSLNAYEQRTVSPNFYGGSVTLCQLDQTTIKEPGLDAEGGFHGPLLYRLLDRGSQLAKYCLVRLLALLIP